MEKAMLILKRTNCVVRSVFQKIGKLSFWMMALLCFGLRVLVKPPFGALLALVIGCVWAWINISVIRAFLDKVINRIGVSLRSNEKESLWFENGGRDKIKALISELSAQGKSFCNLSDHICDLPPGSHWHAISIGLEAMGVTTQTSGNTFYISW